MYYPELYSMQTSSYGADLQNKLQCSGCQSALSNDLVGWKPRKNPLHFGGRHVDTQKNAPPCLMVMGKREIWQLSKQLSMQIHSSDWVARAANVVHWDGSDPLPTGPPEKCLSTKHNVLCLNVWLLQGVKCSLHHWKHLPALGWFQYQTAAATGENHHVPHWIHAWLGFYTVLWI